MRNPLDSDALDATLARPTPVLRLAGTLVKLESLRPSGGTEDRLLPRLDAQGLSRGAGAVAVGTASSALANASWARSRGVALRQIIHGALTHEVRKALAVWDLPFEVVAHPDEALSRARALEAEGQRLLPLAEDEGAVAAMAASLGAELLRDLATGEAPGLLVGPVGSFAALFGAAQQLRVRFPDLRVLALCGADGEDELPDLPAPRALHRDFLRPGDEVRALPRARAAQARARLAQSAGLLASHSAAAAIAVAAEEGSQLAAGRCALALATSTGEREFSLDALP